MTVDPKETYVNLLGDGNAGAITILAKITEECSDWPLLFGALLWHKCTGVEIWLAFKDRHGQNFESFVDAIRKDRKP